MKGTYLVLVVGRSLLLSDGLELGNELGLVPSNGSGEGSEGGELPGVLEADDSEGVGHADTLLLGEGVGDSLVDSESGQGGGASGGLVGHHTAKRSPEHLGGGLVMPGTSSPGVGVTLDVSELGVDLLVSGEGATKNDIFGTHDHDILAVQQFLGDESSESSE